MKVLHISDTHGLHSGLLSDWLNEAVEQYRPDVLVHSGDFMRHSMVEYELEAFFEWFKKFDVKHKILVAGNHDRWCEQFESDKFLRNESIPKDVYFLLNEEVVIEGIKFWGSPYTPEFFDWAFQLYDDDGLKLWSTIPDDVDVLITHGPAKGTLDLTKRDNLRAGCPYLAARIDELPALKAHLFGHIHESAGLVHHPSGYIASNGSTLGRYNIVANRPQLVEIEMNED